MQQLTVCKIFYQDRGKKKGKQNGKINYFQAFWAILFPGCKIESLQYLLTPAQEMAGKKANPSEMVAELPLASMGSRFHPNIYLKLLQSDFAPLLSEVLNLAQLLAVLATMVRKSMKAHSSVTKWQGKKLWNHKMVINAWPKTMQISQWLYNWSKKLIYYLAGWEFGLSLRKRQVANPCKCW